MGAIPGALPPVIGWTTARGHAGFESRILFAILFLWQMPHFLSISWLYREDYKKAGFVMLASFDPACRMTGRQSLLYTLGLVSVSFTPAMLELTSFWYLPVAGLMGGYFLWMAFRFAISETDQEARHLFVASIVYFAYNARSPRFCTREESRIIRSSRDHCGRWTRTEQMDLRVLHRSDSKQEPDANSTGTAL